MATKSAIGTLASTSRNRIAAAMAVISEIIGVEPIDLDAVRYRDPAFQSAARLDALATWAEQMAEVLGEVDESIKVLMVKKEAPQPLGIEIPGVPGVLHGSFGPLPEPTEAMPPIERVSEPVVTVEEPPAEPVVKPARHRAPKTEA